MRFLFEAKGTHPRVISAAVYTNGQEEEEEEVIANRGWPRALPNKLFLRGGTACHTIR